jgi:two-component system, chemotaxis family, chemotaxis protein CheY
VRRVLVVDDSTVVARQLTRILEESGRYQIIGHAPDGISGVKRFKEDAPDIVCMDVVMPNLDGIQALRLIRQAAPEAVVVMMSSMAGVADTVAECLKAGATSVLAKPFDAQRVLEVLDAA